ncbi:hypothetical protein [Nocardia sp. NPDC003963]
MDGPRGLGPLPDSRVVSTVFARVAGSGAVGRVDPYCPLLAAVAGLVDAHRRLANTRPNWDDMVITWVPGEAGPELPEPDPVGDPFTGIWDEAQRHILTVDLEAHRVLGAPRFGAVEHHEGLGAVFGRMAHLYTVSFGPFVLDGPQALNRRQLARAYFSYESLARALACGEKSLPPLSARAADDNGGG